MISEIFQLINARGSKNFNLGTVQNERSSILVAAHNAFIVGLFSNCVALNDP